MQPDDMPGVMAIQQSAYPVELIENRETLQAKLQLSPASCWLAEQAGKPVAYLFAHPWPDTLPPDLNRPLIEIPHSCTALFIHDLALHPSARRQGLGQAMVNHALDWAHHQRFKTAKLIAVEGAHTFWASYGFGPRNDKNPALRKKLAAYGAGADYLEMLLDPKESRT